MLKDPSLAALVNGGGWVVANGHLRIALPLVDGTIAVYGARSATEWYFDLDVSATQRMARLGTVELSPSERVKGLVDAALNILAAVEARSTAIAAE